MVILNVMFAWPVEAGYLAGNPLSLSGQHARRARLWITRYLQPDLSRGVSFEPVHGNNGLALAVHPGLSGWLAYPRAQRQQDGRLFVRREADGHKRWWLEVLGKDDKERLVSATNAMAAAYS